MFACTEIVLPVSGWFVRLGVRHPMNPLSCELPPAGLETAAPPSSLLSSRRMAFGSIDARLS